MEEILKSGRLYSKKPTLSGTLNMGNNPTLSGLLGMKVTQGLSAYEIAVEVGGFEGSEQEWLDSLKGEQIVLEYDVNEDKVYWRYSNEEERHFLYSNESYYINGIKMAKGLENNNTLDYLGVQPKGDYIKRDEVTLITNDYIDEIWME